MTNIKNLLQLVNIKNIFTNIKNIKNRIKNPLLH